MNYNQEKEEYICYVKMQKCEIDLQNLLEEEGPLDFHQFFPLFKDMIFGITFLHGHYMAHRDIKPMNLMRINNREWKMLDYGIGENIKVLAEHSHKNDLEI